MKQNNGFTLVEILVTMAIVSIVGLILVTIFTNTLRGSTKSQILAVIKQNGQSVLENMDKTIRNSDNVVCKGTPTNNTIVVVKNGVYTRYRIVLSTDGVVTAPLSCVGSGKNGCIVVDNPTPSASETTPPPFINRVCGSSDPMSSAQILTDTNTQTGIKVESGSFNLSPLPGYKNAATIVFSLKAGVGARQSIAGQIDPVEFKTTIGLR